MIYQLKEFKPLDAKFCYLHNGSQKNHPFISFKDPFAKKTHLINRLNYQFNLVNTPWNSIKFIECLYLESLNNPWYRKVYQNYFHVAKVGVYYTNEVGENNIIKAIKILNYET